MSSKFKVQSSKFFCCLSFAFFLASCGSVPNLEIGECTKARTKVREFYSFHFGNDMKPSKENLQTRAKFLSPQLKERLSAQTETATDYFTATEDYPKAFRIGECEAAGANKTVFQVVLFWKDDARSEQREIKVEAIKQNDKWLIGKVGN